MGTGRKAAGNLKCAKRNLGQSVTLARTAANVIAARARLAATGDTRELSRMVPEKILAFSAANIAFASHATGIATQIMRDAGSEWSALEKNADAVRRARTLAEASLMQYTGLWAWWGRVAAQSAALGARLMQAQYAAIAPVAREAQDNLRRLSR